MHFKEIRLKCVLELHSSGLLCSE